MIKKLSCKYELSGRKYVLEQDIKYPTHLHLFRDNKLISVFCWSDLFRYLENDKNNEVEKWQN